MSKKDHWKRCYEDEKGYVRCYSISVSTVGAVLIVGCDLALLFIFTRLIPDVFLTVASVGVVTLLGVLALADYVSIEASISTGEMRSALTASIVIVYLVVVASALSGAFLGEAAASTALASTIIQHLSWVVGVVVLFYFGSKAVLQYAGVTRDVKELTKKINEQELELEKLKKKH